MLTSVENQLFPHLMSCFMLGCVHAILSVWTSVWMLVCVGEFVSLWVLEGKSWKTCEKVGFFPDGAHFISQNKQVYDQRGRNGGKLWEECRHGVLCWYIYTFSVRKKCLSPNGIWFSVRTYDSHGYKLWNLQWGVSFSEQKICLLIWHQTNLLCTTQINKTKDEWHLRLCYF